MFKLSEDAPTQHIALLAVAGCIIFLSIIDSIKSPSDDNGNNAKPVSEQSTTHYRNPRLSLIERIFCRGYQRSLSCGFTFYHPMRRELEAQGQRISEGKAPDGVTRYRGYLHGVDGNWEQNQEHLLKRYER